MSFFTFPWRPMAAAGAILILTSCTDGAHHNAVASNPPPVAPGPHSIWYVVSFDSDSHKIDASGQSVVNQVITQMLQNPASIATIIGKTDTVGSQAYNMHLSHQRADAVRDFLVYSGHIPADRVETRWTGERRPNMTTGNDVAATENRVVDIAIH
jgi:outer membrane protein OmpA-like peptidoglycan-associated protein